MTTKPYPNPIADEFAGRRALVTGGSRGIGAAVAQLLLDGGAQVVTSARTKTEDTPEGSTFIPADIRTPERAKELVERTIETLAGLDIVINNAGATRVYPSATAIPAEEWQDSLNVNFLSAVWITNAAADALKASGNGAVVNVLSTSAFTTEPIALHYAVAKSALYTYNKGMAQEFAPHGVRVNAITPGSVETPGGTEVLQSIADAFGAPLEALTANIPLGRRGIGRDIAEAVTFLASNRAQWITGANLMVTGGANGGQ
jgi:NAD(P)-dependent dehydrogenase (short-subunit alcohol dehydrogenase family)